MFKIHFSNCSFSNPSWFLNKQLNRGIVSFSLSVSNTRHSKILYRRLSIKDQSSKIKKPFVSNFSAALCTMCCGIKSWAWNPFTSCLELYIPLQHLYRILQMIDPSVPSQSTAQKKFQQLHVLQIMQEYWITEDLTDFKLPSGTSIILMPLYYNYIIIQIDMSFCHWFSQTDPVFTKFSLWHILDWQDTVSGHLDATWI